MEVLVLYINDTQDTAGDFERSSAADAPSEARASAAGHRSHIAGRVAPANASVWEARVPVVSAHRHVHGRVETSVMCQHTRDIFAWRAEGSLHWKDPSAS